MKNDINELNKDELIELRSQINNRFKKIKAEEKDLIDRKNGVKDKTKLSQLTTSDRIFGIGISGISPTPDDISAKWNVHIIDYCKITEYTPKSKRSSEWNCIGISHGTEPFGIRTSLDDAQVDKHYLLILDTFSNGYDQFYTLQPETWEEDILNAYNDLIESRRKYYEKDNNILRDKIKLFLREKDKIDDNVKHL